MLISGMKTGKNNPPIGNDLKNIMECLGLDEVRKEDMGYIFEELVRKFSESYDEEAGAHFTARDIIYLMTDLLIAEERDVLINENKVKTIYDMAMGTLQMLACMTNRLKQLNKNVNVA